MTLFDALEEMKKGKTVTHAGRSFRLSSRGVEDVTDSAEPKRVTLTPKDWDALEAPQA